MNKYQAERFFVANGEKYRNMWQAYEQLEGTPHNVQPIVENSTFENLKGLKINDNIDYETELLQKIFKEYDNTCLLYSAGVDSHTIAVLAKKNNLQFDKILTLCNGMDKKSPLNDFQVNNDSKRFFSANDRVEIFYPSIEFYEKAIMTPKWWLHTPKLLLSSHNKLLFTDHYDPDTLYVSGKEKPNLLYKDKRWYLFFTHTTFIDNGHLPNNLYFFGINNIMPEIAISQARKLREYYLHYTGTPESGTVIHHKMKLGSPDSNKFILGYNDALGRHRLPDTTHETSQTRTNNIFDHRGVRRMQQLIDAGRQDIIDKFVLDCKHLYDTYPQIEWDWPMFVPKGRIPWILDIDSLECLPGDVFSDLAVRN